jgi:hypothetical protein
MCMNLRFGARNHTTQNNESTDGACKVQFRFINYTSGGPLSSIQIFKLNFRAARISMQKSELNLGGRPKFNLEI